MIDFKALAVVMVSVAAAGVATSGGLDTGELSTFDVPRVPSSVGAFAGMVRNPETDRNLEANLTVAPDSVRLRGSSESLTASGINSVEIGGSTLASDSDLIFHDYKGLVETGNTTKIRGSTGSVSGETFSINKSVKLNRELETDRIQLNEVDSMRLVFEDASGRVNSDSVSTDLSEKTRMVIPAFSGNITVMPRNGRVMLDGKASGLSAGELSFN
jgi:hypothetical protein